MIIEDIIKSRIFLEVFIKDDIFLNSLKEKFPEILADLTTLRSSPNCSCRYRTINYLISKIENKKDIFSEIFSEENIKNVAKRSREKQQRKRAKNRI